MREETGRHLTYLDGWRGIAVLLVIVGHFGGDETLWSGMSKFGVELFFVLSGRLMAEILFVRKVPLTQFFLRRFSRVYPALLVFVLAVTAVFWGGPFGHKVPAALTALTFTINYAMIYGHQVALLDHLWSLSVEEHSYILLAVLTLFVRPLQKAPIIGALGLVALLNGVVRLDVLGQDFFFARWRTDVAAAPIFISAALWLYFRGKRVPGWLPLASLSVAGVTRVLEPAWLNFGVSTLALALAMVTLDNAPKPARAGLSVPALRWVGALSYSLYLWQQPFYKLHRAAVAPAWVLVAAAVACAAVSFYVVEQPARAFLNDLGDRWSDRRRRGTTIQSQ